jgi:hypothetical protein
MQIDILFIFALKINKANQASSDSLIQPSIWFCKYMTYTINFKKQCPMTTSSLKMVK